MSNKYANRTYTVRGSFAGGEVGMKVTDGITPSLRLMVDKNPGIARRALRHTAWRIQKDMKSDLAKGEGTKRQSVLKPSIEAQFRAQRRLSGKKIGKAIHLPHRLKKSTTHGQLLKKHIRHPYRWMGSKLSKNRKMARAIGYDNKADRNTVRIGWLSRSAVKWAKEYQDGRSQRVTKKTRKYYGAIGIPLKKSTTVMRSPANPFIPNYFRKNRAMIGKIFSDRFIMKFNESQRRRTA